MSGSEFLGTVPSHWSLKPLRLVGRLLKGIGGSKVDVVEDGVPCVRYGDLYTTHNNFIERARTYLTEERAQDYTPIEYGDVLFAASGETIEEIGKSAVNLLHGGRCGGDVVILRPAEPTIARFLGYATDAAPVAAQKSLAGRGTTVKHVYPDELREVVIAIPPLKEQQAIADYLDRETARIDALIAAKERLLGVLAEKRRALITRAVIRGLDPHAPFRDSGIPWLGDIPAHWRRAQLRRFMQFITSGSRGWAAHYSDSGALFVRIGNLTRDSVRLDLSDVQYVEPPVGAEGERTRVRLGDVLLSITAYLGSVAFVDHDIEEAYVNQHIALVRLDQSRGLIAPYAAYVALSEVGQTQLVAQSYGGTKTQLALDDVRELWFPLPPADEQAAIVEFVEASLATLDRLQSVAEATVRLLRERRSALIAAAVTGQIDVEAAA